MSKHLDYFKNHPASPDVKLEYKEKTSSLFSRVEEWGKERGLDNEDYKFKQALKVMEEVGETMSALAKNNTDAIKDGIGDSIVTLIILAMQCGTSAEECLRIAYNEIANRKGKTINGVFIKE